MKERKKEKKKDIAGKDTEWNHFVQNRKTIWAVLNMAINFRLPPKKCSRFLTKYANISFSRKTMPMLLSCT
jgi:hypothetical protein